MSEIVQQLAVIVVTLLPVAGGFWRLVKTSFKTRDDLIQLQGEKINALETQRSELMSDIADHRNKIRDMAAQIIEWRPIVARVRTLEVQQESLVKDLSNERELHAQARELNEEHKRTINTLQIALDSTQKEAREQRAANKEQIEALRSELAGDRAKIETLTQSFNDERTEKIKLEANLDRMSDQLESANDRIRELETYRKKTETDQLIEPNGEPT